MVINGAVGSAHQLVAFVDADFVQVKDTRRSISARHLCGCTLTYSCKTQKTVVLSSTESKYMTLVHGMKYSCVGY